jgi:hypothetical protein
MIYDSCVRPFFVVFVCVPEDIIYLQLYTPKVVGV